MSIKPFLISLCCAFGSVVCHGQTLYDLSDVYLKNADFNANYTMQSVKRVMLRNKFANFPVGTKTFQ